VLTGLYTIYGVEHTIFVNTSYTTDCVVGAVEEQVYSGVATCSRDNTRHQYPEMLHFLDTSKSTKCVQWLGSAQTRWGNLQHSPSLLARLKGGRWGKGKGKDPNVWSASTPVRNAFPNAEWVNCVALRTITTQLKFATHFANVYSRISHKTNTHLGLLTYVM